MASLERVQCKVKNVFQTGKLLVGFIKDREYFVKGDFIEVFPNDELILFGEFQSNYLYGKCFETHFYREVLNEFWLAKWLKINKPYSDAKIINMIVEKKDLQEVSEEWEKITRIQSIFKFLYQKGIPAEVIAYFEKRFRWKWDLLIEDPYLLLQHPSISYELVEEIISSFNCKSPNNSKGRYLLEQLLKKAKQNGHLYLPYEKANKELKKHGVKLQNVELYDPFYLFHQRIYLKDLFELENQIAQNILTRLRLPIHQVDSSVIQTWENQKGFILAKNQVEAVNMALKHSFCIVTGGPGVGKTTVCNAITDILGNEHSILMVAPTGRAAKRAKESTGLNTSTVHRLLEYNGIRFNRNENNPIETDCLVIDESSMVDSELLLALLKATPINTRVIFVGDVDQLPSVGPGQILRDMIESEAIPVTRLTEIFRQAADSPIINCAYSINDGKMPDLSYHPDLHHLSLEDDTDIFQKTIKISEKLYRKNNPFDVQILIPLYKGPCGIDSVNKELQKMLNPNAASVKVKHYELRLGDKVIQTKNDYEKGIYNGDVGIITSLNQHSLNVLFQGEKKETVYTKEEFHTLQLSYAITVHRSQGSEYKFAIIPVADSHGGMLQKNLLYTAITRTKKRMWLIYNEEALEKAVHPESVPKRFTSLRDLLLAG